MPQAKSEQLEPTLIVREAIYGNGMRERERERVRERSRKTKEIYSPLLDDCVDVSAANGAMPLGIDV